MCSRKVNFSSPDFMSKMFSIYSSLQLDEKLGDVTLVCQNQNIRAHKVVLSAGSLLFHQILSRYPHQDPVISLPDFAYDDFLTIINFMYFGQIFVKEDKMEELMEIAKVLQVKGIEECKQESDTMTAEETLKLVKIEMEEDEATGVYDFVGVKEEPSDSIYDPINVDFPSISLTADPHALDPRDQRFKEYNPNDQRYECDLCGFRAMQSHKLKMHKELQHEGIKLWCCPQCDYPASSKELMQFHLKRYHERVPNNPQELPENLLKKDFRKDEDGKLICEHCDYRTKYHHVLKKHKLSQHSYVRYKCTECHKYFSTNDNMKRHVKSVHTDERPNPCSMCQYRGKTSSHLKSHMMAKHPECFTLINGKYLELKMEGHANI
eukprot:GFUD01026742.1.p1 GENE.GFUD01026742.1~~GFUD01026742.1.p1  ORF type:complete len:378 (-),score=70.13 GFUD01026742.1:60-1193(-)